MARVERNDQVETVVGADVDPALIEQQLQAMEHPRPARRALLPWLLGVAGVLVMLGLGIQASFAYATIASVNDRSRIVTANPLTMFQDIATNGPQVGAGIESSSRATYTRALEQFVLDGTGVVLGFTLLVTGVFIRLNL